MSMYWTDQLSPIHVVPRSTVQELLPLRSVCATEQSKKLPSRLPSTALLASGSVPSLHVHCRVEVCVARLRNATFDSGFSTWTATVPLQLAAPEQPARTKKGPLLADGTVKLAVDTCPQAPPASSLEASSVPAASTMRRNVSPLPEAPAIALEHVEAVMVIPAVSGHHEGS